MNENKELNDNLERLFASIKNSYDISGMIRDFNAKGVAASKDYEILEYRYGGNIFKAENLGEEYCKNSEIVKVRRVVDSKVFNIGDKMNYTGNDTLYEGDLNYCVIKKFTIHDGDIYVNSHFKGSRKKIIDWVKVKDRVPLFTTDDGKEIFEGDSYWWVNHFDVYYNTAHAVANPGIVKECKYFSTEDKAKEYISWNKPQFSLAEIMANSEFMPNFKGQSIYQFSQNRFIELAQKKINNQ